jgi:hypothetical protein
MIVKGLASSSSSLLLLGWSVVIGSRVVDMGLVVLFLLESML